MALQINSSTEKVISFYKNLASENPNDDIHLYFIKCNGWIGERERKHLIAILSKNIQFI